MFKAAEKTYRLVRVGLVRAACPRELEDTKDNLNLGKAIVIEANEGHLGKVAKMSWYPASIIIAGAARRKRLLSAGIVYDYAFVESGVKDIRCDDEISSRELMEKLSVAIRERILGPKPANCVGMVYPYIVEVYPFENYFIYSLNGEKYRQSYSLDPVARVLKLHVGSTKVEEKYVDASVDRMPLTQTGLRYSPAPVAGNNQTMTQGAKNSELVTGLVRNWKNVLEAVAMYLSAIRNGQHKPPVNVPAFAPVNIPAGGKLGRALAAHGIDVYDFATWSAAEQDKKEKDGLPASAYAYVGDKDDTSTWHLKIHDAAHVRNALARVNQVQGIPTDSKAGVMTKLHKLAKKHGIGVQEKATPKQRTWMKKSRKAA